MRTLLFLFLTCTFLRSNAQIITTFAGNGTTGSTGDGGPATAASTGYPTALVFDKKGNLYFTQLSPFKVRKVTPSGIITTIAGTDVAGYNGDSIPATNAQLRNPEGIAVDDSGNVYISDTYNNRVRKVDVETGMITTIAGNGTVGYGGDNGPATAAIFNSNFDICLDHAGNLYISDYGNSRIRKIDTAGIITTVAGTGTGGFSGDGGLATNAKIEAVDGISVDAYDNLYLAQTTDLRIRKIDHSGIITTIAGNGSDVPAGDGGPATAASLDVWRLAFDGSGNLFVATYYNDNIRMIDAAGIMRTVAGTGAWGFSGDGGQATAAQLSNTVGVALDSCGNLYIADRDNKRIRKVNFNPACWSEKVQEITSTKIVSIIPNPAHNELTITASNNINSVGLYNLLGQAVKTEAAHTNHAEVDVSGLPAGVYMIIVTDEEGRKTIKKMVKE